MALPYLIVVLSIVLLNSGSSRQQAHISVCEQPYVGCVGFHNKQDNFSSFRQCLKLCNFKKVPGAKSLRGYSCIDYSKPCSPLTFYQIPSFTNPFVDWTKCLEVCHLLTNDNGKASASGEICMQPQYDCFTFANSKETIDKFTKCYIDCQVTRKENHTHLNYMYVCNPYRQECMDSIFFTLPEEEEPKEILTQCYKDCGIGEAPEPKTDGYKCDEDSETCVACTDAGDDCLDLSACEETCGKETPEPKTDGYKCDEDSETCVACTDAGDDCLDLSACEETCGKETPEPKTDGYKCDEDSETCVACTDAGDDCLDLSACEETCGKETPEPKTDGYKCDEDSKTCVACTDAGDDCLDLSACEETCVDNFDDVTYKCDEDSKTCTPCTKGDENCSDFYTCDEICQDAS
ncbi:hypothetical protein SprV_0802554000 [Sparganum proliferum]